MEITQCPLTHTPWCGENKEGKVFGKWWLGTDGTYFGLFLESPWPFVIMWTVYGFSAFLTFDNQRRPDQRRPRSVVVPQLHPAGR